MNWLRDAFRRWKERHWDKEYFPEDRGGITPLRAFWEKRRASIMTFALCLIALIAGALILSIVGLG